MFKSTNREIRFKINDLHTAYNMSFDKSVYMNNLNRSWFKLSEYKDLRTPENRFGLRDLEYATRGASSAAAFDRILSHFFRCMDDVEEMYDSSFDVSAADRVSLNRALISTNPKYGEVVITYTITTKFDKWVESKVKVAVCADPFERYTEVLSMVKRSSNTNENLVDTSSSIRVKKNK